MVVNNAHDLDNRFACVFFCVVSMWHRFYVINTYLHVVRIDYVENEQVIDEMAGKDLETVIAEGSKLLVQVSTPLLCPALPFILSLFLAAHAILGRDMFRLSSFDSDFY